MNFGNIGVMEMLFVLLIWAIPLTLLVWFVRTLTAMATSLREVADRLASLERTIRDRPVDR
jgi:hypothetical protein